MDQEEHYECLLSTLYRRYFRELRAHIGRRVALQHEAEDLVQDVFLRVHRSLAVKQIEHPRAYLHQVANSVVTDYYRKNQRRGISTIELEPIDETQTPHAGPTPEESAIGDEVLDALCRAIASLPLRVREALMLRKVDGLSYREVAATMGISERTVEKHLARAASDLGSGVKAEANGGRPGGLRITPTRGRTNGAAAALQL